MSEPRTYKSDPEHEADLINGRACASCGRAVTREKRVPYGGFWRCLPCSVPPPVCDCGHDKSWHEDFREKAAQPCLKCSCSAFAGAWGTPGYIPRPCDGVTHRFVGPLCKCGAYTMNEDGSLTMNNPPSWHQPDCTWRPENLWEAPPEGCCAVTRPGAQA